MLREDAAGLDLLAVLESGLLLACVGLFCVRAEAIALRLGVLDHPDANRKLHAVPTPLVGGIAIMAPLAAVALLEAWRQPHLADLFAVLALVTIAFLALGHFDDRRHLSPRARLLISTLVLTVTLAAEPRFLVSGLSFAPADEMVLPLGVMAAPFTFLCLLGFQNAVNMADGANGLAIGLASGWVMLLLVHAPPELSLFLLLLLCGLLVVLPFNLGGRLFLGDAGSYTISVVVGLAAIYAYNRASGLSAVNVMLWFLVPVVDCLRVIGLRLAGGRSPFSADRAHLHHRLMRILPWPGAMAVYLAMTLLPGAFAELAPGATMLLVVSSAFIYLLVLGIAGDAARRRRSGDGRGATA